MTIQPIATQDEGYAPIPLAPVTSNQVAAIGHDPATNTLAVTFTRTPGHVYHYPGVSAKQHAEFVGAESIGKHFGKHFRALPFKKFALPKAKGA